MLRLPGSRRVSVPLTRMPGKMHSFYIESCYLRNELARGVMEIGGTRLDLSKVQSDVYVLSAGRFVFRGTPAELGEAKHVLDQHLGVSGVKLT